MESEELNELSFCINFKEKETTKFSKKMQNTLFWGPFCPNFGKNEFAIKLDFVSF